MADSPLEFFKAELQVENTAQRIENLQRAKLIAAALGPARTVSDLLPLLREVQNTTEDEFLFCLAEQYQVLADFIGGEENLHLLVPPLDNLVSQEETVVRERAAQSISALPEKCKTQEVREKLVRDHIFPLVKRLAEGEWFTCRVAATGLLALCYRDCGTEERTELRTVFVKLCEDETPMVRRAAAASMKGVFMEVEKQFITAELLRTFKTLAADDTQDSIRVSCLQAALELARVLSPEESRQHTLPILSAAHEDPSWRVRLALATGLDGLIKTVGPEITMSYLLNPFQNLLKDPESDVRAAAVTVIEKAINDFSVDQLTTFIIPAFQPLSLDSAQSVRAALANVVGPVARKIGREATMRLLLPLIQDLMKDDFHDVRLNVVCHAGEICEVMGSDQVSHSILTTVQTLTADQQWRIRLAVVEQIPRLARHFGSETFQASLEGIFLEALGDSVWTVRETTLNQIETLASVFGEQWVADNLVPRILKEMKETTFAHRVTGLRALIPLSRVLDTEQVEAQLLGVVLSALKDSVPNVRFAASRVAAQMASSGALTSHAVESRVKPVLAQLAGSDSDVDVVYFAGKALVQCDEGPRKK